MKYHIVTYGCQMNVHESEKLAGLLESAGYVSCDKIEESDVILFNTCAIREGAQDRVFGNVGALKKMKKEFPEKVIAVCGCMTQQKQIAEKMQKTFPFVDIIFGTHNTHLFMEFLNSLKHNKKRILHHTEEEVVCEEVPIVRTSGKNAWVNIIYGCNNFCTYCIVPYVRGRERSREKSKILSEITQLVNSKKYDKITLLGQNVNSYGNDKPGNGNFNQLLNDICKIEGDFKLTFMTSHPKDLSEEVIRTIANQPKILKEIHLPIQSGSNNILKKMNRKYTVEEYLKKVQLIKQLMPQAKLTTDLIVGFPGETEKDFEDTCNLVSKVKYDSLFAFMYSERPNTPAINFENKVSEEEKNRRVNIILNLEKQIQKEKSNE